MIDLKKVLKKSVEEVGHHLTEEWFLNIIKSGKKFEGWLQVELAHKLSKSNPAIEVEIEKSIEKHNSADISFKINQETIYIEIKLISKNKSITTSRTTLFNQMSRNRKLGRSLAIVFLASNDDQVWIENEIKRLVSKDKKMIHLGSLYANELFSFNLFEFK
jgi:hypothetical protein